MSRERVLGRRLEYCLPLIKLCSFLKIRVFVDPTQDGPNQSQMIIIFDCLHIRAKTMRSKEDNYRTERKQGQASYLPFRIFAQLFLIAVFVLIRSEPGHRRID